MDKREEEKKRGLRRAAPGKTRAPTPAEAAKAKAATKEEEKSASTSTDTTTADVATASGGPREPRKPREPKQPRQPKAGEAGRGTEGDTAAATTTTTTTTAETAAVGGVNVSEGDQGEAPRLRGVSGGQQQESEDGSPDGSPMSESPERDSDLAERMKRMQLIELATRPGLGSVGQRIFIIANHFEIVVPKAMVIIQYEIEVFHQRIKLNRDEKRAIFWKCVGENPGVFTSIHRIAFDGEHICVTLNKLVFPKMGVDPTAGGDKASAPAPAPTGGSGMVTSANGTPAYVFTIPFRLPRMEDRTEPMMVRFQYVGAVNVSEHDIRMAAPTAPSPNQTEEQRRQQPKLLVIATPMNLIDILFRQGRTCPHIKSSKLWYPYGSTVYHITLPEAGGAELGFGQMIWQGLYGGSRAGEGGCLTMNFDVSNSGFYKAQNCIKWMVEVLNSNFGANRFGEYQLNVGTVLPPNLVQILNKELKGLKIMTVVKPHTGATFEREYRVNSVGPDTSNTREFDRKKPDNTMEKITIAQYFVERYGALKYPNLPVLCVGSRSKQVYLPIERCHIANCQRVNKKLLPDQTTLMIKAVSLPAPIRKDRINYLVNSANFQQDPWLKEFGIKVNPEMKKVEARILPAPRILYGPRSVVPKEGSWNGQREKFHMPAEAQKFGLITFVDVKSVPEVGQFFTFLHKTFVDAGMQVPQIAASDIVPLTINDNKEIEPALLKFRQHNYDLVFVLLPTKNSPLYNEVKRAAEIICGIMTQCVCKPTVVKTVQKRDAMTAMNIALKVNAKLGGINWLVEADRFAKMTLLEKSTLVLGVDVSHPGPTERKAPSIASVVGNLDDQFMRYAASVRVQKHRRESVIFLQDPVRERIYEYFLWGKQENDKLREKGLDEKPNVKPQRIIVFRDGVAESQFQDVLKTELLGIQQACQTLGHDYKPSITLIVGQKRHHTRFFAEQGQACGRGQNIIPGTVVDRGVCHPNYFEFFLCSHYGIQGTSRPIRYHVLTDDNKYSSDQLQMVTYYLTHTFSRCSRPVSLPAPLYYADLACARARIHLHDKIQDFSSDTMSESAQSAGGDTGSTGFTEEELIKASTVAEELKLRMYFT